MMDTEDTVLKQLIPNALAGILTGVQSSVIAISCASLIFTGNLSNYLLPAIGIALLSSLIIGLIVGLLSSSRIMAAGSQDIFAAITAITTSSISLQLLQLKINPIPTVLVSIAITTLTLGLVMFLLGRFKLGNLIRFIPFPVVGGFLAGSGWIVVRSSFTVMTNSSLSIDHLPTLLAEPLRWLPALCFAIIMIIVLRHFKRFFVFPTLLLLAFVASFVVLHLHGYSLQQAKDLGYLMGPFPAGHILQIPKLSWLSQISWQQIGAHADNFITAAFIGTLALLLRVSGFEMIIKKDLNINHELQTTGAANIVTGLFGGIGGWQHLSMSVINHKLNANSRTVCLISSLLLGAILLMGAPSLSLLPRMAFGAILLYLGLSFMVEWIIDARKKLSLNDYAIVILIALIIANQGLITGVSVGVLVALTVFVVKYSRTKVIKTSGSAKILKSNVIRNPFELEILEEQSDAIYILALQGYLFFGNTTNLLHKIDHRMNDASKIPLQFLLIDFQDITGIDSSATMSAIKILRLARLNDVTVVFTGLSRDLKNKIDHTMDINHEPRDYQRLSDLDHGIERCENKLIRQHYTRTEEPTFEEQLQHLLSEKVSAHELAKHFKTQTFEEGDTIYQQGDDADGLHIIESGVVEVTLKSNSQRKRLRTMSAGTVIGEMGLYQNEPRSATVKAIKPCIMRLLTRESLEKLEKQNPSLASQFHAGIVRILSERINHSNQLCQLLME